MGSFGRKGQGFSYHKWEHLLQRWNEYFGGASTSENGLLRPLIHRQWAGLVARMNELEESRLEEFLFGVRRIPLDPVRPGLQDLQGDRCLYCGRALRRLAGWQPCVDHFIPWARYPNNAIENLVVAHERCNNRKRDFLAAAEHVVLRAALI